MAQQQQYGMFGPLPWEVKNQQQQAVNQEAMGFATLNPEQMASYGAVKSGNAIGQGISTLLGGEDPAIKRARRLEEISKEVQQSGIDPNNFEQFYGKLGEKLASAGMVKEAAGVADALQAYKDKQYTMETKKYDSQTARIKAEAFRNSKLRSETSKAIFGSNDKYDPESLEAYSNSITEAKPDGDLSKLKPLDKEKNEWKVEGVNGEGRAVWSNKDGRLGISDPSGRVQPYGGSVIPKGGVNVTTEVNSGPGSGIVNGLHPETVKSMAADLYKGKAKFDEQHSLGQQIAPVMADLEDLVKGDKITTGEIAPEFMNDLRRITREYLKIGDEKVISANDMYDAYTRTVVMPKLKAFGGSDSEKELRFAEQSFANRKMPKEAMLKLIAAYKRDLARMDKIGEKYNDVVKSGNDPALSNFNWSTGNYNATPARVSADPSKPGKAGKTNLPFSNPDVQRSLNATPQPSPISPQLVQGLAQKFKSKYPNATEEQIQAAVLQYVQSKGK